MNLLSNLWRDLTLILTNIQYLFLWKKTNKHDVENHEKILRFCPKRNPNTVWSTLWHFIVPRIHLNDHHPVITAPENSYKRDNDGTIIFYINGVLTSENKYSHQVHYLSYLLRHKVVGLYNPTNGLLIDILECFLGRTLNIREPIVNSYAKIIKQALLSQDKVILIGHSQGGIVISNIIKRLKQDAQVNQILHKLEVYTFGSGADEMPVIPYPPFHFVNTEDFVARIGVLGCKDTMFGIIRPAYRTGHSFEKFYLTGFADGEYGTDSNLYQNYIVYK